MEKNVRDELVDRLTSQLRKLNDRQEKNIKYLINDLYTQLESFSWLQKGLAIKRYFAHPLRGWPVSPDLPTTLASLEYQENTSRNWL